MPDAHDFVISAHSAAPEWVTDAYAGFLRAVWAWLRSPEYRQLLLASRANSLVRLFREHRMRMWLRKMIDVNNGVPARSTDHEHSHGIQRAAS